MTTSHRTGPRFSRSRWFLGFLVFLAVNEEKDMRKQFGAEFDAYAARTPRFLPSLSDTRQRG